MFTKNSFHKHQHPFIDRVNQDNTLSLLPLCNSFANPCSRTFLAALMNNATKGWIYIIALPPFTGKAIKAKWKWIRARVKIKGKLCIKLGIKRRGCKPIVLTIIAVTLMKFIFIRAKLGLMAVILQSHIGLGTSPPSISGPAA